MPWYAIKQIRQGTALAYDVGHPVPDSNVQAHGYDRDGSVAWVEPGEEIPAPPETTPLMGAFPNAPQRPEPQPEPEPEQRLEPEHAEPAASATPKTRRGTADTTTSTDATEA